MAACAIFDAAHAPKDAPQRCLEGCPYYAPKLYLTENIGWPVDILTTDLSYEGRRKALLEGPYGRCVYRCDNDVVARQVVNLEFEGGAVASFTMTTFTTDSARPIKITGTPADAHSLAWAQFGEAYPFNEYGVSAGAGGYALMQRLCDKDHSWGFTGLAALIADVLVQGLTEHPYSCPDMIGGGECKNFYQQTHLDEGIFIAWAATACLMPAMQFSATPWRILSEEDFSQIKALLAVREYWKPVLMQALEQCRRSGEPIVRPVCYHFPEAAAYTSADAYMVGNELIVAPIVSPYTHHRQWSRLW